MTEVGQALLEVGDVPQADLESVVFPLRTAVPFDGVLVGNSQHGDKTLWV